MGDYDDDEYYIEGSYESYTNQELLDARGTIDEILTRRVAEAEAFLEKVKALNLSPPEAPLSERPLDLDHELPTRREDEPSDEGFDLNDQ